MTPSPAPLSDVIRTAVTHFNRGDVETYLATFTVSCPHHVAGLESPLTFEEFASSVRELRTGLPDCRIDEVAMSTTDRFVTAHWRTTGTHTAPLFGIDPTHRTVVLDAIEVYEVDDARFVTCSWVFGDPVALIAQIS